MFKWIFPVLIAVLAGGNSSKSPEPKRELLNSTEELSLMVSPDGERFSVKMHFHQQDDSVESRVTADEDARFTIPYRKQKNKQGRIITAPQLSMDPGVWATMEIARHIQGYDATVFFRIDGGMLDVSCPVGSSLKIMVTPASINQVRVKGILAQFEDSGAYNIRSFPFDTTLYLGENAVVYRKECRLDPAAVARYNQGGEE